MIKWSERRKVEFPTIYPKKQNDSDADFRNYAWEKAHLAENLLFTNSHRVSKGWLQRVSSPWTTWLFWSCLDSLLIFWDKVCPLPCTWLEEALWSNIDAKGSHPWFWCACSVPTEKPKETIRHPPWKHGSKTYQHGTMVGDPSLGLFLPDNSSPHFSITSAPAAKKTVLKTACDRNFIRGWCIRNERATRFPISISFLYSSVPGFTSWNERLGSDSYVF